jgi:hypothetical protein
VEDPTLKKRGWAPALGGRPEGGVNPAAFAIAGTNRSVIALLYGRSTAAPQVPQKSNPIAFCCFLPSPSSKETHQKVVTLSAAKDPSSHRKQGKGYTPLCFLKSVEVVDFRGVVDIQKTGVRKAFRFCGLQEIDAGKSSGESE